MKITIDTTNKTVQINESVNLSHFIDTLKELLPGDTYREYTIVVIDYNYRYVPDPYNPYPTWIGPHVTYSVL